VGERHVVDDNGMMDRGALASVVAMAADKWHTSMTRLELLGKSRSRPGLVIPAGPRSGGEQCTAEGIRLGIHSNPGTDRTGKVK
jgi:hypothetical protein